MHTDDEFEPIGVWKSLPGGPEYVGLAAVLLPFVITMESYSTHNGVLTNYSNTPATLGGGLAILCALISFTWISKTTPKRRGLRSLLALALLVLGGVQIARGQGVFFKSPGQGSSSSSISPVIHSVPITPKVETINQTQIDACIENKTDCARILVHAQRTCQESKKHCDVASYLILKAHKTTADVEQAYNAALLGCEADNGASCNNVGVIYRDFNAAGPDEEEAGRFFVKSCELGHSTACTSQADYWRRSGKNMPGARDYFIKGCKGSGADAGGSCRMAAVFLSEGQGGPKDMEEAIVLGQRGCDLNDSHACSNLGFDLGNSGPESLKAFLHACELGKAYDCNQAGFLLDSGGGVPEDAVRARKLISKSCDGDSALGCANLGQLLVDGRGGPSLLAEAYTANTKGCNLKNSSACYKTGEHLWYGQGVDKDRKAAKAAFVKACEMGDKRGCKPPK